MRTTGRIACRTHATAGQVASERHASRAPKQEQQQQQQQQQGEHQKQTLINRRNLLQYTFLACVPGLVLPQAVHAYDLPWLGNIWQPMAPAPVKFPRRKLDQRFAVLLMRSSYDAADALDFVPMDQFQKDFWKLRASEQEPYMVMYSPLKPKVGDLTDPLYFDFISFSQYATISREITSGRMIFKEYCAECESGSRVVQRAPSLPDNGGLPLAFFQTTGDSVYTGLVEGFREKVFDAPPPCPAGTPIGSVLDRLQQVLQVMVDQGYAIKAEVRDRQALAGGGAAFTVAVEGPANLWGLLALSSRQSLVLNAFDAMVTDAFLRASGRQGKFTLTVDETGFQEEWEVA